MRFDARAAKQLKAGEHITLDGCPGLRLEATLTRRSWIYRYKSPVDGLMRQTKIGGWPAMSHTAAIAAWETLRAARDNGADPAAEKRTARQRSANMLPQANSYTVRMVCNDYLSGHVERHRKSKGALEIQRMFRTMLGDVGKLEATALTRAQAFDLLESHKDIPVQAAKLRAELGAAWDYALDAGRLPETTANWWRQIMRGRLRSRGKRIEGKSTGTAQRSLSESELAELLRWLPNFSRLIEDALTMYLWTATRGSEIVSIEASEVSDEPDGLWWTIPKAKTKNARHEGASDLRVPLVGRAETIVRRRLGVTPTGYLFKATSGGGHSQQAVIQTGVHYYQPYSKTRPEDERPRLPVSHWAPHDLRRTVRTMLASMDCPDEVAEAVLGHMQPGVRGVYNKHQYDRQRRDWLVKLSNRLEELAATKKGPPTKR